MPKFSGDDKINPTIWFIMVKEHRRSLGEIGYILYGEYYKWWIRFDEDTRYNTTLEEFEEII